MCSTHEVQSNVYRVHLIKTSAITVAWVQHSILSGYKHSIIPGYSIQYY